ncbi:nicotinate-nucleotide adenylyltransferase [Haloferula helveola]|uniref:Nicotinate-nucleotide adenylyltransferase n=1 Tax=Haloferula helveola TaxID=490095 RepID=A0ABN6H725_9BACT|nr:nicotinate-nucleotide adenylyltransferase [Haloferula helveola]
MNRAKQNTYDKVLELNLDPAIYGTFAEIGAGQETANWFFRASGTAGTVAKSISAYDMTMSDAIYGKSARYVSRQRLGQMLDHEFSLLVERLGSAREKETTFFSFCNTVRARGYRDSGECHGWLGLRFQLRPGDPPSEIFIHVRLLDDENVDQMEALGVVGVNFIHAAFRHRQHLERFATSLTENLAAGRVEVDMLKFAGHGYDFFDNRLCALQLVESGLTDATLFRPNGEVEQAADALYKRPILLLRGSFDPVTKLHLEMLEQARGSFNGSLQKDELDRTLELCEISMTNLLRGGSIDHVDFIDRADALQALGKTVLVSRCAEFHRIAAYLSRYTTCPVGIVLSIGLLNELFKPKWSENLPGGLLESFGRLFRNQVSLYVYPWRNRVTGEVVTADSFRAPEDASHLYRHFMETQRIRSIPYRDLDLLKYTGRDIQRLIREGDPEWKSYVPEVAHRAALHLQVGARLSEA